MGRRDSHQWDGSIKKTADTISSAAHEAEAARERARSKQVRAVSALREEGLIMQDIAIILGVTQSRISQPANA